MKRAMRLAWVLTALGCASLTAVSGCRLGGGSGAIGVWPSAQAQTDAGLSKPAADGGAVSNAGSGGGGGGSGWGTGGSGTAPSSDAQAPLPLDAGVTGAGEDGSQINPACHAPATVNVCNPVTNTGCATGTQCDVDLVQPALTGLCVFNSPMDGGGCFASPFTESCPAKTTCDNGACRDLCFCDTDCPKGECCHDTLGTLGFKLCKPC